MKNCFKNAKVLDITADYPFPYYPKDTNFEMHGVDYTIVSTSVAYAVQDGESSLTHRLLLQPKP